MKKKYSVLNIVDFNDNIQSLEKEIFEKFHKKMGDSCQINYKELAIERFLNAQAANGLNFVGLIDGYPVFVKEEK